VVNWSTVRALMMHTVREKLHTRLVDCTNAFAQVKLKESVYVEVLKMYKTNDGSDIILKLNKSLYGLVQTPLCCFTHLREGFIDKAFTPSESNPCLYLDMEWQC